ncbi:MAG TPA: TlpA disulfide reductase family protein [Acidimicrobiales bacterium]|nr:TlpA disulfide reductase family protein [Acidimicrobiales bacterium]
MVSRRVPRPVLVGATVLVVAAVVALVAFRGEADDGPSPDEVRAVELGALGDGAPVRLGDLLTDGPVVVNFFAEWCQPCRQEMPAFERVHQERGDDVTIVGVSIDHQARRGLEVVDETGVTYPTYADPTGEVLALFEGTQMPTTVFVNPDGSVAATHMRELEADDLRAEIDELLA